ncbi:transposable element Tcb2 transposase [Trichonephila clavipes]|nr:transposable element Tcb2 transposase [Trichonephila clavipes]
MANVPGAIFQQDNAQSYTAWVLQDCLHHITTLPWPARSLDVSPIERIWDHLGRQGGSPTSLIELETCLQQLGNEISQGNIRNLCASMPAR